MPENTQSEPLRALIVKPSSLGDILHAFPAADLLAEKFPNIEIDWLIHPAFEQMLDYNKHIKNKIIFDRKKLGSVSSFLPAFIKLFKELRKKRYDIAVDMQGLFRSALIARLAKSNGVTGFASPRESLCRLLYKEKVEPPEDVFHAVERNIFLIAERFQVPSPAPGSLKPLPVIEKYSGPVKDSLKEMNISDGELCMGIIPGARWRSKCWPAGFFAELINLVAKNKKDAKFLIFGSEPDKEAADEILEKTKNENVISLAGKTGIGELVEFIRRCNCVATNDSGPMHIAAALNVPTFAFFGATFPEKTGPYGKLHSVFQPNIGCIKCFKKYCQNNNYKCHESIDSENVAEKILEFLNNE